VDDYHLLPQTNPKDWRKICRGGLIWSISIEDDSGGTVMFRRAQSLESNCLNNSVQTLGSITEGSDYQISLPAVVVVTPAAAAVTAPIQRKIAMEAAADRNVWRAIKRSFTK
jgi:hypothetical protein